MEKLQENNGVFKRKVWVTPCPSCDCNCSDEDEAEEVETLVFDIPGVEKKNIKLDVAKDRVKLVAERNEGVEYFSEYFFDCEAKLDEEPSTSYNNGVLQLEVPVSCPDPYEEAKHLKIQ